MCVDRESADDLQRSAKLRMGVNVEHIRVTKLDDRIHEDASPTVCFTYGAGAMQKTELKQA